MKQFAKVLFLLLTLQSITVFGQNINNDSEILNTVTTAVPFLRIGPDARSGSMGDAGVALKPDANSWFWNAGKMAFAEDNSGVSITYTPWLAQLVDDIYLAALYGYQKIDDDQTVGGSLRYFSLGNINFTDANGGNLGSRKPNEFALDFGYSRKLSEKFGAGIMLRFIYSDLASGFDVGGTTTQAGRSGAVDFGFYYTEPKLKLGTLPAYLNVGLSATNIGAKIAYSNDAQNRDFIPTNLGLGTALGIELDAFNKFVFTVDINKLLVPTPDTTADQKYKQKSVVQGILGSFNDAPGGFQEELNEFTLSVGAEYWYNNQFAIRAGHFREATTKGNRRYFALGLGLKFTVFSTNVSYLVPSSSLQNGPLDNTLRFSFLFDIAKLKNNNQGTK